jgi:hypothetical protein
MPHFYSNESWPKEKMWSNKGWVKERMWHEDGPKEKMIP